MKRRGNYENRKSTIERIIMYANSTDVCGNDTQKKWSLRIADMIGMVKQIKALIWIASRFCTSAERQRCRCICISLLLSSLMQCGFGYLADNLQIGSEAGLLVGTLISMMYIGHVFSNQSIKHTTAQPTTQNGCNGIKLSTIPSTTQEDFARRGPQKTDVRQLLQRRAHIFTYSVEIDVADAIGDH